WLLPVFLFCYCITSCKAQPEKVFKKQKNSKTLLWEVSGNGLARPSFLFGTFHLLCRDDIHFSDQLLQAIQSSNEIYMELDMDDPSTLLSGMLYMNMKNGKKLQDLYSADEYNRIQKYFADTLHTPMMLFQKAKPYFLVALLYPRMMNCSSPAGVEEELLKVAKENKKEIKGLETMQFQASVFDSIPYDWQAKELLKNIDSFAVYKKEFADLVDLYKNQNLDSMQNMLVNSEFGSDKYDDLLLKNRNKNWVGQLKNIMKNESVFVAVGAGHLTGDDGLIALLKKMGYKVEPLVNQ
ncbi:MAG: TraB/GumN family protein, partial [Bacteroidota bacterium]|nr:TraB/GumN family protein [Bacteroidota bacterium]